MQGSSAIDKEVVSVIIPCYNGAPFLEECFRSILNQGYENIEIVFVDDGSQDHSSLIARRVLGNEHRAKIVETENHGVAHARNLGLSLSSGSYVLFLDADDGLAEDSIESLLGVAKATSADMTYGKCSYRYGSSELIAREIENDTNCDITAHDAKLSLTSMRPNSISGSCCRILFRSDFLKRNGQHFPEGIAMSEDFYFILECLDADPKISYLDEVVYRVRRASESVTQGYMRNLRHDMEFVNERLWRSCKGDSDLEKLFHGCVANTAWTLIRNEFRNPEGSRSQAIEFATGLLRDATYVASIKALTPSFTGFDPRKAVLLKVGVRVPRLASFAIGLLKV